MAKRSTLYNLGMNRNINPLLIKKGEWRLIVNADLNKNGVLKKRKGYLKMLNTPDANEVLSLIPIELGSTVRQLVMISAAGKLYSSDLTGATWGSAVLTGLSGSARWGFTIMSDISGNKYAILGNGAVTYKTANGTSFTSVSGAPLAKYWTTLNQRVYGAGVAASPDTLFWSSIGDLTDWSGVSPSDSSSTTIDNYYRGNIKGIRESNDRVVVYKERMMKRWDGETLVRVRASSGAEAPYSIADIEGMTFSFDREGIRMYDGNTPALISERIKDLIEGIDVTPANLERICGEVYKNRYYLSVGNITDEDGKTITNAVIVYDFIFNEFLLYSTAHRITAMKKFINITTNTEDLYIGDLTGNVYKMFGQDDLDDTVNIEMKLESHIFYPAGINTTIEPNKMTLVTRYPDEMQVFLRADYKDERENIGEFTAPVSDQKFDKLGNDVRGLQIEIGHSAKGRPEYYGSQIEFNIVTDNRIK
jgi:hypothetical protein